MTPVQLAVAHGVKAALVITLLGLIVRGHARECASFALYLAFALTTNLLQTFWPERFHTYSFWMTKQAVFDVLRILVATELAWWSLHAFPGARRTARLSIALILLAVFVAIVSDAPEGTPHETFSAAVFEWHPRILSGTIWLFTATALAVAWYRIPVGWMHRSILMGFSVYLLVFTTLLNVLRHHGWDALRYFNAIDPPAYLALTVFWAWAAWRPRDPALARRETGPLRGEAA